MLFQRTATLRSMKTWSLKRLVRLSIFQCVSNHVSNHALLNCVAHVAGYYSLFLK